MGEVWHVKMVAGVKTLDPHGSPSVISKFRPCGCEVVRCGGVVPQPGCEWHDSQTTNRKLYGHSENDCPVKGDHERYEQLRLL